MAATVVIMPVETQGDGAQESPPRIHVEVQVSAEILPAETVMHSARAWLAAHVGERLGVATPELVVNDGLFWRFEVTFSRPNDVQPGSGAVYNLGQIRLDAATGAVANADALAAELRVHVASLAP